MGDEVDQQQRIDEALEEKRLSKLKAIVSKKSIANSPFRSGTDTTIGKDKGGKRYGKTRTKERQGR